jgi:hypothetical protein
MRTLPTLLGSLLLLSACAPTPTDDSGDNTAAVGDPAFIGPDDFVHCGMTGGVVSCQYTPVSSDFPFQPAKVVAVLETNNAYPSADLADGMSHSLGASPGGAADIMLMPTFVEKQGVTYLQPSQQSDALDVLKATIHVTEGATVKIPFPIDVWPIALIGSGTIEEGGTDAYAIQLAPWTTYLDHANVTRTVPLPSTRKDVESDLMLVVTHGASSVGGTAKFCDESYNCQQARFTFSGANIYNVSGTGLTPAGQPSTTPTPPPSNDTPDMAQPPTTPGDPDTSCGGANQQPCNGQDCDPHFVYQTPADVCVACGADGETACANETCDAGTVYVQVKDQCVACGANAEPACANEACDAGTVYVSFHDDCETCGGDGQLQCAGGTCNPGLTAGFDGECHQ